MRKKKYKKYPQLFIDLEYVKKENEISKQSTELFYEIFPGLKESLEKRFSHLKENRDEEMYGINEHENYKKEI